MKLINLIKKKNSPLRDWIDGWIYSMHKNLTVDYEFNLISTQNKKHHIFAVSMCF